jgi:hypothetical protein
MHNMTAAGEDVNSLKPEPFKIMKKHPGQNFVSSIQTLIATLLTFMPITMLGGSEKSSLVTSLHRCHILWIERSYILRLHKSFKRKIQQNGQRWLQE